MQVPCISKNGETCPPSVAFVAPRPDRGYFERLCEKPLHRSLAIRPSRSHPWTSHPANPFTDHMSTLNPTRKVSRRQELREDTVVTFYARALNILENNRQAVIGVAAGILAVIVLILAWNWYQGNRNDQALSEMAEAVRMYEAGSYQAALDGNVSYLGLLDIVDSFGGTDTGNLARFYAADALFRVGEMDRALDMFESFSKGNDYIGASAFAGEAAIHELQGNHDRAGDLYMRAANVFSSDITSPMYLSNAARAYEAAGDTGNAIDALEMIEADFPESQAARTVEFKLARLEAAS